ncbi:MAG: Fe-S protein [Clostridiaceae bacterium]|nr:Fe-S protein [Clostridiaceae bacterium]
MDILKQLENCKLCRRSCGVNRLKGEIGYCKAGVDVKVARAALHYWEEPCISGKNGSGTIFFSNCNLNCVFCQNHQISQEGTGRYISIEKLSNLFLEQQERGAHNINLVTPTHYIPQIIASLQIAKSKGLKLPILFNTNSYISVDALKLLNGYVDVYLPDLKYFNDKYATKYSNAPGYFKQAAAAIEEMFSQVGEATFNKDGIITKGIIIRHLMLPGLLFDSKKVADYIHTTYGNSVYMSIMNQYTPLFKSCKYNEINKPLNPAHYDSLVNYCLNIGIINGFIQESGTSSDKFVPEFNFEGL